MKSTTEIQAAAGSLRQAVAALSKVIPRKPAPDGLNHVLVEPLHRNTIRITGVGPDTFLSVDVPAEIPTAFEPFLISFPGLQTRVKGTRTYEEIELHPGSIPVARFPEIPKFRAAPVTLEPKVTGAILRAFACVSTDQTRMVINGALIDAAGGEGHHVVGTDGKHLFGSNSFSIPGMKGPVILPAHPVWKSPILRNEAVWTLRVGGDSLSPDARWYRIDAPGWSLTGRLIEGNFPNYHQVIPGASSFKARVVLSERTLPEIEKLLGTLPGAKLPHRPVGLRLEKRGLSLLARESEEDFFDDHPIPFVEIHGDPVTVLVDRDYLAKAFRFGLNRIEFIDAVSPVKISRDGDLMIVMPVRCQGEVLVKAPEASLREPVREALSRPEEPKVPTVRSDEGKPKNRSEETQRMTGDNPVDPVETAALQLVQAREALRLADSRLGEMMATLRAASRQRRRTEKEMQVVRGTLRGLRKIEF